MMEREEIHWTDDPDLMERFVLHELNPDKLNELEDHLRICEVCKHAVRTEQLVVAGIRKSGRERFKAELRKKIAETPEAKTPWMQIMSAAAVVVILVSVGIYNDWFSMQQPEASNTIITTSPEMSQQESARPEAAQAPDRTASKPTVNPHPTQLAERKSRVSPAPEKEVVLSEPLIKEKEESQSTDEDLAAGKTAESATSNDLWVEGSILPSSTADRTGAQAPMPGNQVYRFSKPQKTDKRVSPESNFSVHQQNTVSLQLNQQRVQNVTPGRVLANLQQVDSETQLTLYLDSLVDANELANATIETPTPDSVIVNLSNQRIGYRLPPDWKNQLQNRRTK